MSSSSSKRASTMPTGPKPPTRLSSSLIIAENASLIGHYPITLGSNTVIHPRVKINSTFAPVTIGSTCIISERSVIGYQSEPKSDEMKGIEIGNGVVVEVGAIVEAREVGEGTLIEVNARIGKGAVVGKHCKIGPACVVEESEDIPDYTVVLHGMRRVDSTHVEDLKLRMVARQAEVLRKLIPSNLAKFQ